MLVSSAMLARELCQNLEDGLFSCYDAQEETISVELLHL